jgi:hypothetical protein
VFRALDPSVSTVKVGAVVIGIQVAVGVEHEAH